MHISWEAESQAVEVVSLLEETQEEITEYSRREFAYQIFYVLSYKALKINTGIIVEVPFPFKYLLMLLVL